MIDAPQLDLFGTAAPRSWSRPVKPNGKVCRDDQVAEVLSWVGRKPYFNAEIQIARDRRGRFMWSTSAGLHGYGGGYAVGEKWGKFAPTREDALACAIQEMRSRWIRDDHPETRKLSAWLEMLR